MLILGIETSCDETAASVVRDGHEILSDVISSQIAKHAQYGGVIPELAAREHIKNISWVVEMAIKDAGIKAEDLDAIAVTQHPGLVPALAVGVSFAKGLAITLDVPIIGTNHFLGHIYGAFLEQHERATDPATYPLLSLVVSGGHTALVLIDETGQSKLLGQTIDDAAGEAFDKGAKLLNLGYPGGPIIDRLAKDGDPKAYRFPRALTGDAGKQVKPELKYSFSFSGVKTSLLYKIKEIERAAGKEDKHETAEDEGYLVTDQQVKNLVASYQTAVVDVLVKKSLLACKDFKVKTAVICGGVACNSQLRKEFAERLNRKGVATVIAAPKYCTDNAAMIAGLAFHYAKSEEYTDLKFDISSRVSEMPRIPFNAS